VRGNCKDSVLQLICYRSCNLSAALYPLQRLWPYTMGVAILRECGKHKAKMYGKDQDGDAKNLAPTAGSPAGMEEEVKRPRCAPAPVLPQAACEVSGVGPERSPCRSGANKSLGSMPITRYWLFSPDTVCTATSAARGAWITRDVGQGQTRKNYTIDVHKLSNQCERCTG
jgi:hypothetical protein